MRFCSKEPRALGDLSPRIEISPPESSVPSAAYLERHVYPRSPVWCYYAVMTRTTLSLPDELAQALTREAHRRSVSASAVAREAIAKHLGFSPDEPRKLPFAGIGRSGHRTTGRDMEELLAQEWNGDIGRS
jgi:hypothetical protein